MKIIPITFPVELSARLLTAASLAALITLSAPAMAQNNTATNPTVEQRVNNAWESTKETARDAANAVSEAAEDTYESTRNALSNRNNIDIENVTITNRTTASGIIGKSLYNMNGQSLAKVDDIIIDSEGNAQMVVLSHNNLLGLGKVVAFDYSVITRTSDNGDIISSLSEEMIDNAAEFSYKPDNSNKGTTMQRNHISLSKLMDGHLVAPNGEKLADIENLSLKDGKVDKIIVGFDKTFFMGGKQAALNFNDTEISYNTSGGTDILLSQAQANQFQAYKNAAVN